MEALFSTSLAVNNENINYRVVFDQETYTFIPDSDNKGHSSFSFRREHDEWHDEGAVPPEIKQLAVDALDKYLMKQH